MALASPHIDQPNFKISFQLTIAIHPNSYMLYVICIIYVKTYSIQPSRALQALVEHVIRQLLLGLALL